MLRDNTRPQTARHAGNTRDCAGRALLFLAPGDVSKGRVEPISWMRTCEAYAGAGLDVTLATIQMRRPDAIPVADVWRHFGIDECFRLAVFPTPLDHDVSVRKFRLWAGSVGGFLALQMAARAVRSRRAVPIVHSRSPVLLAPFVAVRRTLPRSRRPLLIFETHALPTDANAWIVKGVDLVVCNSQKLSRDIQERFGLPSTRVLHAPLPPFNPVQPQPRSGARNRLGLDDDSVIACYTGKMTREYSEFFLRTAEEAARLVQRFRLMLVGGNPEILEWTRRRVAELGLGDVVVIAGFVAPADVEQHQSAADVLLYHMPESVGIFPYTTPAKAYEYQAMRRPIVATDFPLFNEVFGEDGERAIRVADRTPVGFAQGIAAAVQLGNRGIAMTERAAVFVDGRTWASRSAAILNAVGV